MTSTALTRLTGPHQRLTLGLELPLDNDWGAGRRAADQQAGRPFGVPDLSGHADLARLADGLGFSALWLRDVPVYDPLAFGDAGSVFDVFAYLGHLAALTEHVVLGTSAVVLPLRSPLHVAKAAATVDVLSGGRLVLGLASGDRPVEYPLFGADFDGRGQAFRDGVRTLRAAWATPAPGLGLALPGTGLRAERRIDVLPKPVGGDIPIAVAGSARQAPEWIAGHADAGLNYPRPLDALRDDVQRWRELTGGRYKPYLTPMLLDLVADPAARPEPIRLGLRTGRTALVDHLGAMADLGVAHVSLNLRPGDRPVAEVLHELAEEVLPHFPGR
ncbi:LLM class oxidoreductase [Streptomyces sp. PA03-6a]|nr:LLM class oxidoreductase [Streptomyces sp. PA03-6a]